jgi:hypothetical protein
LRVRAAQRQAQPPTIAGVFAPKREPPRFVLHEAGSLIEPFLSNAEWRTFTIRAARRDGRSHALVSSFIRDFLICSD